METAKGKPPRRPRDYYYGEVLRLPPGTRAPDHYTLLGLAFFEHDHDTILRAALERLRLLEACGADPRPAYRKVLAQIRAEVQRAQLTLLDPARRETYDRSLTGAHAGDAEDGEEDQELELPVGTMFAGRYRVMGEARRGALGVVYDALDSNLRTRVQLSVLRPSLSHRKPRRRRIEQAARQAALLTHPNILHVDEVGDHDGLVYLRMRAVEGKNLIELIEASPRMRVDAVEARRILAEVAAALKYAHAQGAVHGDLRPHNVFVDAEGRVRIADFCVARAVADELDAPAGRYREPEDDPTPQADLYALGCLGHQLVSGLPPGDGPPKGLPEDVPQDLAGLVNSLLATEPDQRPDGAATVLERLTAERAPRRIPVLVGAAAVFVAAVVAAVLGMGSEDPAPPRTSVTAVAWRLISEGKYEDAVERLRKARAAAPDDTVIVPPLATALTKSALERLDANDPWSAQEMLREAQELEPKPDRESEYARAKAAAERRLAGVEIEAPDVAEAAVVRVRPGDVPLASARMKGASGVGHEDGFVFTFDLADGRHELSYVLTDRVGNERSGVVALTVDTKAPRVEIVAPREDVPLRDGDVRVEVSVDDANPAETVEINGRPVAVRDGVAADVFRFGDGDHAVAVVARDRAGHEARATRRVVVDSKAPALDVAAARIVTRGGVVTVSGRVGGRIDRLTVDGRVVAPDADGAFAHDVTASADRMVPVVAEGATGLKRKVSVEIVVDPDPPAVTVGWPRRDRAGVILYGTNEMDAGGVRLALAVKDKTDVRFEAADGRVEGLVWTLPARQGARDATLVATDEAGHVSRVEVKLEGHRATPKLEVKCGTKPPLTTDEEAILEIESDGDVTLQGKPVEPGRHRVTLSEGAVSLAVTAVDRYGNEARWALDLTVDRTPPQLELVGEPERGIGRQELVIRSNEPLATLTCVGKTFKVEGTTARFTADLQMGRKRLHVVARDRAGNMAKVNFPLSVRNRVLELDGNDAVAVDMPIDLDAFTVEAWVKGVTPGGRSAVLSKGALDDFAIMWGGADTGLPYASLVGGESGVQVISARKGWKWEEWTHVALSFDGRRARFYVDGSLQGSVELREDRRRGKSALHIGAEPGRRGAYGFFAGRIDEVRVSSVARYTRAFSPPKFHREDDQTVALLRFDTAARGKEGLPDSSGHGRNGRAIGNPAIREDNR